MPGIVGKKQPVNENSGFPLAAFTIPSSDELASFVSRFAVGARARLIPVAAGTVNSSYRVELDRAIPAAGGASHSLFLRIYEEQDFEGAAHEAGLLSHLAARGARTPAPIVATDGATIGRLAGKPAALFPWLRGEMRCQESVTAGDMALLGRELAVLHAAAADAPEKATRFGAVELTRRLDVVAASARDDLVALVPSLRTRLREAVAARIPEDRCMVHGDVFRDNVLFDGDLLSCVLDFESAGMETPTYDLAVALLAWAFDDGFREDLARALVDGYRSSRPEFAGVAAATRLFFDARFAALRFVVTRLTDCELKGGKKDFRRFLMRYEALESMGCVRFVSIFRGV